MKKKAYIQPMVNHVEMMPQTIICASVGLGGTTGDINNGSEEPIPISIWAAFTEYPRPNI